MLAGTVEPWGHNLFFGCKCIWCCLYPNMEYFFIIKTSQDFLRWQVIFSNVSVLWCGLIAMNADERSWAYDQSWGHHVGKHEALTVYWGRSWKSLGNAHFNVLLASMHVIKLFSVFPHDSNLQENCDNTCKRSTVAWRVSVQFEIKRMCNRQRSRRFNCFTIRGCKYVTLSLLSSKEQCNPRPHCKLAKPRNRIVDGLPLLNIEIMLFEEKQCCLKNIQNADWVSDKSWFHRVTK